MQIDLHTVNLFFEYISFSSSFVFKKKTSHFVAVFQSLSLKAERGAGSRAIYVNVYIEDEQSGLILGPSTLTAPF